MMIATIPTVHQVCQRLFAEFFQKHPNPELQVLADRTLALLLKGKVPMPGKVAG